MKEIASLDELNDFLREHSLFGTISIQNKNFQKILHLETNKLF